MSKASLKKNKSDILRLKILLEDKEHCEKELNLGTVDLNEVLIEFTKRISTDQQKSFKKFFFDADNSSPSSPENNSESTELQINENENLSKQLSHEFENEPWVKKVYRKIIQRTHPDRYTHFPVEEIKKKFTRIYRNAVDAYKSGDVGMLLVCAYETEVEVEEPQASRYITESMNSCKSKIEEIKNLIGYQWYHLVDVDRFIFLENYLKSLGYEFTKASAQEVLKKRKSPKRKTGTRPEKIRVKK